MQHKICLRRLRSAAQAVRSQGGVLNCATLARRSGTDRRFLSHLVNELRLDLQEELRIVRSKGADWKSPELRQTYADAVRMVYEDGDIPSPRTLAEKLKWRRKRVQRYLREHPDLKKNLKIYTDDESSMWRAARVILSRGELVTRMNLGDEMNRSYNTVLRIIKAQPEWVEELGISRARPGSGVWNRLYPKH